MDCNIIKDKLIDYIDNMLDKDEENLIHAHLEECIECKKEYEDIKESIDYIIENKYKIDTERTINLTPHYKGKKGRTRKLTRTGLIAVIISIILVITAYGTDFFDFLKWWEKSSEVRITAWEKLIDNGVGDILNISVTKDDVKITAESVIADEINTVILLRIEDLKNNIRLTPSFYGYEEDKTRGISIEGDIEKHQKTQEYILEYIELYAKEENTIRLMLITNPMTKEVGDIKINIRKLIDKINENDSRIIKEGNWDLEITANKIESKEVEIDEIMEFDDNEIKIKKITLAPTETNIEYEFKAYNNKMKYYLNSLSFLIEYDNKIYGPTNIGISHMPYTSSFGIAKGSDSLESLYLEDPSEIKLMVEQYRYSNNTYTNKGDKIYNIDFNNLPQIIEYNNSKITIEDIIYNEDSVEIIIKEDESNDRKYIVSDMNITYDIDEDGVRSIRSFFSYPTEWEVRDENGKVETRQNLIRNKRIYDFVNRQKIRITRSSDKEFGITNSLINQGHLHIIGQRYIGYPKNEISIKLK